MTFQTDRKIYKILSTVLLASFIVWLSHDLFLPRNAWAQTSGLQYLFKAKKHWENLELDEAIEALHSALEEGLTQNEDRIEAYKLLGFCWATKRDTTNAKANYIEALKIDKDFELLESLSPVLVDPFEAAKREFAAIDDDAPVIVFTPVTSAMANVDFEITATVVDASDIKEVTLFYKNASEMYYSKVDMEQKTGNTYSCIIPKANMTGEGVHYYLVAYDVNNNGPAMAGTTASPFQVTVEVADTQPPMITHTPFESAEPGAPVVINAEVEDASGVKSVILFHRLRGQRIFTKVDMRLIMGNRYTYEFSAEEIKAPGIEYYIHAFDELDNGPARVGSASEPIFVSVSEKDVTAPQITHTALRSIKEGQEFYVIATIADENEITEAKVHLKQRGQISFQSIGMTALQQNRYRAKVEKDFVTAPGLSYYITAQDAAGNIGYWKSAEQAHTITITPITIAEKPERDRDEVAEQLVEKPEKKGGKTLLWIGLGALVLAGGAVALMGGSGDGGDESTEPEPSQKLIDPPAFPDRK